jgi:hypothetical protein
MEYLMTYGWAILIIAVVLGALYAIGVFNLGTGNGCIAAPGFLCTSAALNHAGNISVTIGQSSGSTYYNVALACAATTTTGGLPNPSNSMVLIWGSNGVASNTLSGYNVGTSSGNILITTGNDLSLASGQTVTVNSLPCYGSAGVRLATGTANVVIGSSYSGVLWMNYTTSSSAPGGANPVFIQRVGTMTLRVLS